LLSRSNQPLWQRRHELRPSERSAEAVRMLAEMVPAVKLTILEKKCDEFRGLRWIYIFCLILEFNLL
jgi:hypothetical protein